MKLLKLRRLKIPWEWLWLLAMLAAACSPDEVGRPSLRLATTTSVENSGLLDAILPDFESSRGVDVDVIAVGTGQALALGERGDVDVVLVHARSLEEAFIASGDGTIRYAVMYNDFVVAGPQDDPAGIQEVLVAAQAFRMIAAAEAIFVSRGDNSGTHAREKEIWQTVGFSPDQTQKWYLSVGQGMGAALNMANQEHAYILTDRGTFLSQKENLPNLVILLGGEPIESNPDLALRNEYSVIPVNPVKHKGVNAALGETFVSWLLSIDVQEKIAAYGMAEFGRPLFFPDSDLWRENKLESGNQGNQTDVQSKMIAGVNGGELLWLDDYTELIGIILLTLKVSGTALAIACALGIPAGVVLGLGHFRAKRLLRVLVYTGMGFPPVVVGLAVFLLFSNGGSLGVLEWLFTAKGMIVAQSILAFPLATGLTSAAVEEVPKELVLQVRSLGATPWQERGTIFWEARRGVAAAVLAALGRIISEVGAAMLVGGNIAGRTRVLSTAIVLETRQGNFDQSLALGMVLLGIALLANVLMMRFAGRWPQ